MADIITNTKTVLVRLTSAAQDGRSITLDNPRENITLTQIKQAFKPMLDTRLLLGNKGDNLDAVESATVTTTQKVKLGESEIEISVSPGSFTVQIPAGTYSLIFTVTGSTPIGAYFTNVNLGAASIETYNAIVVSQEVQVQYTLDRTLSVETISGEFNIVTADGTVKIPLVMQS